MIEFERIDSISLSDENSWKDKIFLTIDIDWASDEVLNDTIDLIEKRDIKATWFITHKTKVLERLRENPKFELGLHPNFNYLMDSDFRNGHNATEVLNRVLELVPDAKSIRSHEMTQSSYLLDLFKKNGLVYDCNHFIPEQTEIELKPWKIWNNIVKIPYFWEDDINCVSNNKTAIEKLIERKGLKVFDFHPIHIFLNTENIERYNNAKKDSNNYNTLLKHRGHDKLGTRELFINLINL